MYIKFTHKLDGSVLVEVRDADGSKIKIPYRTYVEGQQDTSCKGEAFSWRVGEYENRLQDNLCIFYE